MIEVVYLSESEDPPQTDRWVHIRQPQPGRFVVSIREHRGRPVIKFERHVDSLEQAIREAEEHALRIGVTTIHVVE